MAETLNHGFEFVDCNGWPADRNDEAMDQLVDESLGSDWSVRSFASYDENLEEVALELKDETGRFQEIWLTQDGVELSSTSFAPNGATITQDIGADIRLTGSRLYTDNISEGAEIDR